MNVETLVPLGKVDPGLRGAEVPPDISRVAADARLVEEMGYDGLVTEEIKDDPYIAIALAAQATTRLKLATAVALAFPRSPMITATSAWSLQKLSNGRFTLGLGSQVKAHIQRRFGMVWSPPGPWMREYIPCGACHLGGLAERRASRCERRPLHYQSPGTTVCACADRAPEHSDPPRST